MDLIKTKSFELAVYKKGDENSSRLALILPGRLDTKDYPHMVSHVDFFAKKGYLAVSFDPPGTWESPGDISLYTTTNYLKAINELVEYFGNKPTVLMGHSRGGSMAMLAGAQNEHVTHIIAVMSNAGPSSIPTDIQNGVRVSYRDIPNNDSESKKRFDLPMSYFEDSAKYQILPDLIKSQKPKLFFYSSQDKLVSADRLVEAYEACLKPKMLHKLEVEHDYRLHQEVIGEVNRGVEEFLTQNP